VAGTFKSQRVPARAPEPARVLEVRADHLFALWGSVLIANWRLSVTSEGARSLARLALENAPQVADGRLVVITVAERNVIHPDAAAREALDGIARSALTSCMAIVLLGDGAAAMRRLVAGISVLVKLDASMAVFDSVADAARWAVKQGSPGTAPADLGAAVEAVRAL